MRRWPIPSYVQFWMEFSWMTLSLTTISFEKLYDNKRTALLFSPGSRLSSVR